MKHKVKLAITKIISLQAEFTPSELDEAMDFIRKRGLTDLFAIPMVNATGDNLEKTASLKRNGRQESKSGVSKILMDLEGKDSEKYQALAAFEALLKSGEVLTRLDSIKKVGISIDKDFQLGRSRKDAIPKLMAVLANLPLAEINNIISSVKYGREDSGLLDEGYQNLANYLLNRKN